MDIMDGFSIAMTLSNLGYCAAGVFIGTLVGVLPGIGPVAAMSILFPATVAIPPVSAVIMLAGIYYGAMCGGSTTSILVNMPGEASSVVTCLDGYQMAKKGRGGVALGISTIGSFIAGTMAIIALQLAAPHLAKAALIFGFPEYFSLMCCGLVILTFMAQGSMIKSLMLAVLGLFLGSVGMDLVMGTPRFDFGIMKFQDGVGLIPVIMGLFGISEVLLNLERKLVADVYAGKISRIWPSKKDWNDSVRPIARGSLIGFFLGLLPGAGPVAAGFVSYSVEKKLSKHPEEFGKGAIQGVAGPEAANNAAVGGAFVPLLTLAIPATPGMAILLGAFLSYGVNVGPLLITSHPEIFWGVVVSMYIGNVMLLVLNLPLIGIWVKILKIPYSLLFPFILVFCVIGSYSLSNDVSDVVIMVVFGVIGYIFKKTSYEAAPLVMAMVLSPLMENNFRQSLLLSQGDFTIFFTRPISALLMGLALLMLILPSIPFIRSRRKNRLAAELE